MLRMSVFDQFTPEAMMLMAALIVGAGGILGFITDMVLKHRGFGPIGNGLLTIVGCYVGIHTRYTYFGYTSVDETLLTGGLAATAATSLLLLTGAAKHWVMD